jgi:hypothetical protein
LEIIVIHVGNFLEKMSLFHFSERMFLPPVLKTLLCLSNGNQATNKCRNIKSRQMLGANEMKELRKIVGKTKNL